MEGFFISLQAAVAILRRHNLTLDEFRRNYRREYLFPKGSKLMELREGFQIRGYAMGGDDVAEFRHYAIEDPPA